MCLMLVKLYCNLIYMQAFRAVNYVPVHLARVTHRQRIFNTLRNNTKATLHA